MRVVRIVVRALLLFNPGPTTQDDINAALMRAVIAQDHELVASALKHGADPNSPQDEQGRTPVIMAAGKPDARILLELLRHGGDSNKQDRQGWAPLHIAVLTGQEGCLFVLLKEGADLNSRSITGSTPLHVAALQGGTRMAFYLLDEGADVNPTSNDGSTPLHHAAEQGYAGVTSVLPALQGRSSRQR